MPANLLLFREDFQCLLHDAAAIHLQAKLQHMTVKGLGQTATMLKRACKSMTDEAQLQPIISLE